jgi:hypothetical protein
VSTKAERASRALTNRLLGMLQERGLQTDDFSSARSLMPRCRDAVPVIVVVVVPSRSIEQRAHAAADAAFDWDPWRAQWRDLEDGRCSCKGESGT